LKLKDIISADLRQMMFTFLSLQLMIAEVLLMTVICRFLPKVKQTMSVRSLKLALVNVRMAMFEVKLKVRLLWKIRRIEH